MFNNALNLAERTHNDTFVARIKENIKKNNSKRSQSCNNGTVANGWGLYEKIVDLYGKWREILDAIRNERGFINILCCANGNVGSRVSLLLL